MLRGGCQRERRENYFDHAVSQALLVDLRCLTTENLRQRRPEIGRAGANHICFSRTAQSPIWCDDLVWWHGQSASFRFRGPMRTDERLPKEVRNITLPALPGDQAGIGGMTSACARDKRPTDP